MKKYGKKTCPPASFELVLGAGGVKGYGHVGVLKAIAKHKLSISSTLGVSIGALIAAFYANGFSASEIEKILAEESFLAEGSKTLRRWQSALTLSSVQAQGLSNLLPVTSRLVEKYELKANGKLKIVAYNATTLSPVLFSGSSYNLGKALAASCSVPFVMSPVIDQIANQKQVLVDGFLYHPQPVSFCRGPAIISKLGFASRLPSEWLPVRELFLHLAEQANSPLLNWYFGDSPNKAQILIDSGLPDIASMSFSTSAKKCREMVLFGESQADLRFKKARAAGLL